MVNQLAVSLVSSVSGQSFLKKCHYNPAQLVAAWCIYFPREGKKLKANISIGARW